MTARLGLCLEVLLDRLTKLSNMIFQVYILLCSDGSYYVGLTRGGLDFRVAQHNSGTYRGYTF